MEQQRKNAQKGSTLIEAAIVLPLFFLLLAGIIQFGYVFGLLSNLRTASLVAARSAILGTGLTTPQVCDVARNALVSNINLTSLTCSTNPTALPAPPDSPVTVTLTYPIPVIARFGNIGDGSPWSLQAQTTMQ